MITLQDLVVPLKLDKVNFDAGLKNAISGAAALGTAVVGAMAVAAKATFDWAAQMDSLQDVMEGTNKQAAALNFVVRKSGTDTATLVKGMVALEKSLVKADGSLDVMGESLKAYGINALDANGNVRDQNDLLSEISDKYNSFSTAQERVNFLTDVFGKSGANLIDVFDTLANEGGLDAVADKVERLGLVIDPARYENFTRALEELKLMGLGMAIGFTEAVMPALEDLLSIIGGEGTVGEKLEKLAGWLSGIDAQVASWLDGLDWSGAGAAFGRWIDNALTNGIDGIEWPKFAVSLGNGINDFFLAATGADAFGGWENFFFVWNAQIRAGWGATMMNWGIQTYNFLNAAEISATNAIRDFMNNWEQTWTEAIREWGQNAYNQVMEWINQILSAISFSGISNALGGSSSNNANVSGRASGGPVIGGQPYKIQEFNNPEIYTPAKSGRIDNVKEPAVIDEEKIGQAVGKYLAMELPALINLMKA